MTIDQEGVGELIMIAVERGRRARNGIKLGICGEHGGDPASIAFLPEGRSRLRVVLALSRSDRATCRRAGGARSEGRKPSLRTKMLYHGSCHCQAVTYEVDLDLQQVIACNCSHCSRKGYLLGIRAARCAAGEVG